jgi:hypothetical protein
MERGVPDDDSNKRDVNLGNERRSNTAQGAAMGPDPRLMPRGPVSERSPSSVRHLQIEKSHVLAVDVEATNARGTTRWRVLDRMRPYPDFCVWAGDYPSGMKRSG